MKKSLIRVASIGAVAALLATMAPQLAHAATQPAWDTTTDGNVYLMDNTTAVQIADGTQLDWNPANGVVLSSVPVPTVPTDVTPLTFPAPTGASADYVPFISPVGSERTPSTWKAWGDPIGLGGVGALLPNVSPGQLIAGGSASAVKASGGTFSMGIAYTDSAIVASTHVVKAYYVTVNIDAGTGTWKFSTPPAAVVKTNTTTALTTSAAAVAAGDSVTLTATVNAATATGNVNFLDGTTSLGTSAAAAGVATLTTTALAAGSHSITAVYAGDSAFNGSTSSAVTVSVTGTTGPDSSLLISTNTGGFTVSLTGTVATVSVPAALNGKKVNVYGYSAATFLSQVTISGGSVTVNVASFTTGAHQIALVDATNGSILGWVAVTITNAAQTAPRDLQAIIATSVDGVFALVGPANTTPAVIGTPTLDPITGESVSTGTLGAFSVKDDRSITKKGWTLTADVNNFVNGATSIDKKALGLKPIISNNSGPGTPVLGAEQLAGSAVYGMQFAQLAAGTYSTLSQFDAGLTFRAPLGTPAGTYTSTLTLTLVSK
jgi:hypothetical protein